MNLHRFVVLEDCIEKVASDHDGDEDGKQHTETD